jgi:ubiquinone/menaquinone biosynthesis C-methylase UbiE
MQLVVFLPQIFESVPDQSEFLQEIYRVLKPGGHIIVTARNMFSWFGVYFLKTARHEQVPNFGPYIPVNPWSMRKKISEFFTIKSEFGLTPLPKKAGQLIVGFGHKFCRLYMVVACKKT